MAWPEQVAACPSYIPPPVHGGGGGGGGATERLRPSGARAFHKMNYWPGIGNGNLACFALHCIPDVSRRAIVLARYNRS